MTRGLRLCLGAVLLVGPTLAALAQVSISPPTANPATAPTTTAPSAAATPGAGGASSGAGTLPSAQSVLQSLLNEKPPATMSAAAIAASTNPARTPSFAAAAPNEPKAALIHEGQFIWDRTGHLVKDEKTGTFFFSFEGDGKNMADPPMGLLPSRLLESMEDISNKGALPVTFKVSGEITEYRGKNYLIVRTMQAVRDMGQGLGK